MDPLSTSHVDEIVPQLFVSSLMQLVVFMMIAKLVNVIARQPLLNGAAIFFWLVLEALVALSLYAVFCARTPRLATMAGYCFTTYIPALLAAFFFARSFRRKKNADLNNFVA